MKKNLLALLMLSASLSALCTEYFISTEGNDKNPGTIEAPLHSISRLLPKLKPGDIVTIRGGLYREKVAIRQNIKGTKDAPITIRGMEGESAVFSGGYDLGPWSRTEGETDIWEMSPQYACSLVWETCTATRYLEVHSMSMLRSQPGAYIQDKKSGKLYIHCMDGRDPNLLGMVQYPWFTGKAEAGFSGGKTGDALLPFNGDSEGIYAWVKGFFVQGDYIVLDNLHFKHWQGQCIRLNVPSKGCVVRNVTVYGGTCGIITYGAVTDAEISNCTAINVAGPGIQIEGEGDHIVVKDNVCIDDAVTLPFKDQPNAFGGHPYYIGKYGAAGNLSFLGNKLVNLTPGRRNARLMRCKGGMRNYGLMKGNVFYGAGCELYAASNSTADLVNNSFYNGKFNIGKLSTEEKYEPTLKDNVMVERSSKAPSFIDPMNLDFRLFADSPYLAQGGAFPGKADVLFVSPKGGEGDGSAPQKALSLDKALSLAKASTTIYLTAGSYQAGGAKSLTLVCALRAYQKQDVIIEGGVFNGELDAQDIVFRDCKAQLKSAKLLRCAFVGGSLDVKDALLAGVTLQQTRIEAEKLILRDTLCDGNAVAVSAKSLISENNAFTDKGCFDAFTAAHKEFHKSRLVPPQKLDEAFRIPADSVLAYAALDSTAIGGRPTPKAVPEIQISNLVSVAYSTTSVLVSWDSPNTYISSANVRTKDLKTRKGLPARSFHQSDYFTTSGSVFYNDLTPDTDYEASLYFYTEDGRTASRTLKFRTPADDKHVPVTLKVNAGDASAYPTLRAALLAARKGDTIILAPGVYTESNTSYVDDLTIKSEKPGAAKLDAAYQFEHTLYLKDCSNVLLEGIQFIGNRYSASAQALSGNNLKNITVRNCWFQRKVRKGGCANVHFQLCNVDGLLVENCVFDHGFHGIWCYPTDHVVVRNCTFYGQGINGIHLGCEKESKTEIYNNIFMDTVSNHTTPAVTVAEHSANVFCDYNIYCKEKTNQLTYGFGRHRPDSTYSAPWSVLKKNAPATFEEARKRFGVEAHGFEANPKFVDAEHSNFALQPDSPARKTGKDGKDIGADVSVFSEIDF